MEQKIYLIDTMAMIFRQYYAHARIGLKTSSGLPTGAILGCFNFLIKLIREEPHQGLLALSDSGKKTFRHDLYPDYKSGRSECPEDLARQIPLIYELMELLGIKKIVQEGYEADDLIASVVIQNASPEHFFYIVGKDKDMAQLVNERVFLYRPQKDAPAEVWGSKEVFDRYGLRPDQILDYLAIAGDSSDHIPGVKGIGPGGAKTLLETFGSLDQIYEQLDQVKNKRHQKLLQEQKEGALFSRQLVRLKSDLSLPASLQSEWQFELKSSCRWHELEEFCKRYELKAPLRTLSELRAKTNSSQSSSAVIQNQPKRFEHLQTKEQWDSFEAESKSQGLLAFEFHEDSKESKILGIALSTGRSIARYALVDGAGERLSRLFSYPEITKVAHDFKSKIHKLRGLGISWNGSYGDSMLLAYLKTPGQTQLGIENLAYRIFGHEFFYPLPKEKSAVLPQDEMIDHVCECAAVIVKLYDFYKKAASKAFWKLYSELEIPLLKILADMEYTGVMMDQMALIPLKARILSERDSLEKTIEELAGESFNLQSPKQVSFILFEKLKIQETLQGNQRQKKTKTGQLSTNVKSLEKFKDHPICDAILRHRVLSKLLNTYIDKLPEMIRPGTGRIHTKLNQMDTATGRVSSSDPNLQNIPIRGELGREIRGAFVTSPGWIILSADYSQIELRLLAHFSQDPTLLNAFQSDQDIHRWTAAKVFQKSLDEVTDAERSQAKAINYGIAYGMGPSKFSEMVKISMKEAKNFIDRYFETFPGILRFIEEAIESAKTKGYTETMMGRQRPLESMEIVAGHNPNHIAVNTPLQGSAADLIKMAMICVDQKFSHRNLKARILLQVHDELVCECPEEEREEASSILMRCMEDIVSLRVPLKVNIGWGKNWLDAH